MARIDGIELFQVGTHRGKTWTASDLHSMVRNAKIVADRFSPPVVIGHEAYQPLTREFDESEAVAAAPELFNTGTPKLGEFIPQNLRVEDRTIGGVKVPTLVGDADGLPDVVNDVIRAGAYDRVSAEVYPEPPAGYEHLEGPVLRRVAFLGGQLPHIKTLSDLRDVLAGKQTQFNDPPAKSIVAMSERRLKPAREFHDAEGRLVAVFSEVNDMTCGPKKFADLTDAGKAACKKFADDAAGMTRDDLLALLTDVGFDVSTLPPECPDATLMEIARMARMFIEDESAADAEATVAKAEAAGADAGVAEAEAKAKGETPADESKPAPKPEEKNAPAMMAEMVAAEVAKIREAFQADMAHQFSELKASREALARESAAARRTEIQLFAEQLRRDGKLLPAEIDAGLVDLIAQADAASGSQAVAFSDGTQTTLVDKFKAVLAARPKLVQFAERIRHTPGGANEDEELATIREFAEQNRDKLRLAGRTPEFFCETFQHARKADPSMTADRFLSRNNAA